MPSKQVHIHVKGILAKSWNHWFAGLEVIPMDNGQTDLAGSLPDQAALMGVLDQLDALGLKLVAVYTADAADRPQEKISVLQGEIK
ncbi:MAG TPA: hypothetical protein PKW33_03345 [Anaerolineaceae bacterium]|nr:hypothetical protein [Anaerolineaceae bacterium]HPN50597.1 hypothetical protein [Anaerolineaceae bacterium]